MAKCVNLFFTFFSSSFFCVYCGLKISEQKQNQNIYNYVNNLSNKWLDDKENYWFYWWVWKYSKINIEIIDVKLMAIDLGI